LKILQTCNIINDQKLPNLKIYKMNFTKKTIEKLQYINNDIINFSKMSVEILNKTRLKEYFLNAKQKNDNLIYEFQKYGSIKDFTVYGNFFDEYKKEIVNFKVSKVINIFEIFAFELCKDNFLTYQQSKAFLQSVKNKFN
jgi:hypothetical protein